jgi:hypothetical protein
MERNFISPYFSRKTYMTELEDKIKQLRRQRKLHDTVERRLQELLQKNFPDSKTTTEVNGVLGGRNDLMQFFYDGKSVVFEVFGSASQVPQDLRLLEQSDAHIKIAILIDPTIDESVSKQYFRKKPNPFSFITISQILDPKWETIVVARLHELIDDRDSVKRLKKLLTSPHKASINKAVGAVLSKIEEKIGISIKERKNYSGKEVLALLVAKELKKKDIPDERIRSLIVWLLETIQYAVEIVACGLDAYLISDLDGQNAIYSSGDVIDDLFIMTSDLEPRTTILVYLNPIINSFFEKSGRPRFKTQFHVFHGYAELQPRKQKS